MILLSMRGLFPLLLLPLTLSLESDSAQPEQPEPEPESYPQPRNLESSLPPPLGLKFCCREEDQELRIIRKNMYIFDQEIPTAFCAPSYDRAEHEVEGELVYVRDPSKDDGDEESYVWRTITKSGEMDISCNNGFLQWQPLLAPVRESGDISTLTVTGDLVTERISWEAGDFCMWRNRGSRGLYACKDTKVIPYSISKIYNAFREGFPGSHTSLGVFAPNISHPYVEFWKKNLFKFADKDDSNSLTENEFIEMFEDNIKSFMDTLDDNQNGGIETETEGKPFHNIPYKLLNKLLITVISFFDFDKNNALSFEDLNMRKGPDGFAWKDRNKDGRISLEEMIREPKSLWPQPLYNFYTRLDLDLNEELSEEELIIFVRKTFRSFDKNNDCKVSSEETATLANSLGLPNYYGLGVKILLDGKLILLNYIVSSIMKKADRDQDGKTTYEELMDIEDWDWLEEKAAEFSFLTIHIPTFVAYKLGGKDLRGWRFSKYRTPEGRDKFVKVLLDALDAMLEQPAYHTQVTDSYCL